MKLDAALALLTKRRELSIDKTRVPELGSAVFRARELSARERFEILEAAMQDSQRVNVALWRILAATRGIVDEGGAPLFTGDAITRLITDGNEIAARLGEIVIDLSEADPSSLKSGGDTGDPGQPDAADSTGDAE
jgi:hypothetical protein